MAATLLGLGCVRSPTPVAQAWIVNHPDDVRTLVSHEPPLVTLLEDRDVALRVPAEIVDTYQRDGYGPAMAKFIQLVMHAGPLPPDYLDQPAPEPSTFGLHADDDGSRDDPLLSRNLAMTVFEPAPWLDAEVRRSRRRSGSIRSSSPAIHGGRRQSMVARQ